MPENLGPSPEEMGGEINVPNESVRHEPPSDRQIIEETLAQLLEEGAVVDETDLPVIVGSIEEAMPSLPLTELFEEELVRGEDGKLYTKEGILAEKVLARETFLRDHAAKLASHRIGDISFYPGMLCVDGEQIAQVADIRLENDPAYNMKRKTLVVLTLRDAGGNETETTGTKALYSAGLKKLPHKQIETYSEQLQLEHEGQLWTLGRYFKLNAEESYVGRIAMIPDQKANPGQVVVMLRDRSGRSQLYTVNASDISPTA